jgi:ribosome-binding factor A
VTTSRAERVAEQVRIEASAVLAREVHDPGVGFVTITRVRVSPDLQVVRIFYTMMGDAAARQTTARALERVTPFMRRQLAQRLRLRRVPEIGFAFDESVAHQARVEELLQEIQVKEASRPDDAPDTGSTDKTRR